jgi:hypothetical protein
MTNSATSTDRRQTNGRSTFHAWHFFLLLSMAGATAAVMVSRETHPVALLLLSAAVICAGLVGISLTRAVGGFFNRTPVAPLPPHAREDLQREKALVLRAIKELEFDHAMGKVSETDFASISARLRSRALTLMQELDRPGHEPPKPQAAAAPARRAGCAKCGTMNDVDARFCKSCGNALGREGSQP